MPRLDLKKEDILERKRFSLTLSYFFKWTNQLMYLMFFVVLILILLLLSNYFLLSSLASLGQSDLKLLNYVIIAVVLIAAVLLLAIQHKRFLLEKEISEQLK